jgi:hypothetical protein
MRPPHSPSFTFSIYSPTGTHPRSRPVYLPVWVYIDCLREFCLDSAHMIYAQKTSNSQNNLEQKDQCWRYHNTWLQIIVQSHSNKNSMVLAQNRHQVQWNAIEDPDTNHAGTAIWSPMKESKTCTGEKLISSTKGAENTGYLSVDDWN